jgi:tetratricopeptide (TPR) repeat protein
LAFLGLAFCMPGQAVAADDIKPEITEALNAGDTANAIDLLNAEIDIDPGYHANYYKLGMIYYKRQQYEEAAEQFEIAVDKKSKHWPSVYHLGLSYIKLDQLDKAEELMERGREDADDEEKAWFENGYGLVMMAREKYQEADRAFRAALVIDDDNPEYHINLGDANYYQGIPALAIMEYEKALEADSGATEVFFHWAEACLEMKDYKCAMEKLRVVLQKDSTYANAWMRAGGIYFRAALSTRTYAERKQRFVEAIGSYKKYLELSGVEPDSSNVRVFFEIAMSYVSVGGYEEAVQYFEDVLSIPYEPRDIYFHYGKALWGVRDFDKAAEALHNHIEWVEEQGEDVNTRVNEEEIYSYLGDCYFYRENKNYRQAAEYYETSLAVDPDQKRITYNVAVAHHNMKNFGKALKFYQQRIDLGIDSSKAGVIKNAGFCALNIANAETEEEGGEAEGLGDDLGGDFVVEEATDDFIDPDKNYYEVAVDYLGQYLEFAPDDAKTLQLMASTYLYQLGDCTNGVNYYQQLLSLDPNNCEAHKALGYAYFGGVCTKNYTRALGYLRDAYGCISDAEGACSDVDLILWIAQCYHLRAVDKAQAQEGDFKNANEWYSKCLKCEPGNAECKKGRDDTSYEF